VSGKYNIIRRGRLRPPSSFTPLKRGDGAAIQAQSTGRRFDPSLILGAAARCPFGLPSVIACAPLRAGEPFPTTFWLTCPHLVKLCGSLESGGAVTELDGLAAGDEGRWTRYHLLHAQIRLLLMPRSRARHFRKHRRPLWDALRKGGVGGAGYSSVLRRGAKCLHLHGASWLALGFHPAGEFFEKNLAPLSCEAPPPVCAPYVKKRKEIFHVEG
jgi:hypothetical protein